LKIILESYSSLYNPLKTAQLLQDSAICRLTSLAVIYLADCPFRIPRFTHHSADLSAFLDSAFYFPHSAFRNSAFYQ